MPIDQAPASRRRERRVARSPEEVQEAALQFVRKVSGFQRPSPANSAAFEAAVQEIAATSARLLASLQVGARSR